MTSRTPEPSGETEWSEELSMEGKNLARHYSYQLDLQRAIGRDDIEVQPSVLRDVDIVPARPLCVIFKRPWQLQEVPVD